MPARTHPPGSPGAAAFRPASTSMPSAWPGLARAPTDDSLTRARIVAGELTQRLRDAMHGADPVACIILVDLIRQQASIRDRIADLVVCLEARRVGELA